MKLFLIDGHALIFKMYYAFQGRPMVNSKGVDTSILFGFTKYLIELIERERPTHLAVSFDPPGGTFRNRMYPEYKANRSETPQLVIDALEPLTRIVRALNIPVLMVPDYEADDVIGTVAGRFASGDVDVYMVTPDKDYGQLVTDHVYQYRPGKSGGENEVLDSAAVCAKWDIDSTAQVVDVLAICGDSADNVPGVSGVGPVGASKLIRKYGSLDSIYEHLDELTPRQKTLFEQALPHIWLSRDLVTICTEVPVDVRLEEMELGFAMDDGVKALFDEFEFFSFRKKVTGLASRHPEEGHRPDVGIPASPDSLRNDVSRRPDVGTPAKLGDAPSSDVIARRPQVDVANPSNDRKRLSLVLNGDDITLFDGRDIRRGRPDEFRSQLEDTSLAKAGVGLKAALGALSAHGITLAGNLEDVELMHYVLDPERSHKVEALALSYLGMDLEGDGESMVQGSLFDEDPAPEGPDPGKRATALYHLASRLRAELEQAGLDTLYDRIEEPLVGVLSRMERTGVKVDIASLNEFAAGLRSRMLAREAEVRELAGIPTLNVASPKQIGEVIFERMALDPKAKKPRNGSWPTDEQTLLDLADRSPIIDAILDYRGTRKLLSTYIEPFPSYMSPRDGRVHTTFNQALTATGRLSSSNPNLQNIPIRTEQGREIRKAFVPQREGWVIMSADYSQIELRIMAHLCGDEHLLSAFREGVDVHSATAAKIFRVPVEEVTPEQRRVAKTANFGIMYGISSFGLAQRLKCPRSEAKRIIDDYFDSFPSIRSYIDGTVAAARRDGYVQTLFGRRRYLPDLSSSNANLRAVAERNAVNAPIQGSSADIIKLAMIVVDRRLSEQGLQARMVLQIHDELVLEVPEDEIQAVKSLLVDAMEGVMELSVPLTVECNYGKTWLEAH